MPLPLAIAGIVGGANLITQLKPAGRVLGGIAKLFGKKRRQSRPPVAKVQNIEPRPARPVRTVRSAPKILSRSSPIKFDIKRRISQVIRSGRPVTTAPAFRPTSPPAAPQKVATPVTPKTKELIEGVPNRTLAFIGGGFIMLVTLLALIFKS